MSRTDKDMTKNVFYLLTGERWWRWCSVQPWEYTPGARPGFSRAHQEFLRHYWHGERFRVKMALRRGDDPEPTRTRHSVRWYMDW